MYCVQPVAIPDGNQVLGGGGGGGGKERGKEWGEGLLIPHTNREGCAMYPIDGEEGLVGSI